MDTGFINFGRRDYDPEIGRWLTPDPAGFINGINLYQFNFNNPFRYIDKDGRLAFLLVPLVSVAISFGIESAVVTTSVYAAGTIGALALGWEVGKGIKYLALNLKTNNKNQLCY
jgi:uncharacterized protein RhaS with RHS repeats